MKSTFSGAILRMFAGPLIWAGHFLIIYGYTGFACARRFERVEGLGIDLVKWVIGGSSLAALFAILLVVVKASSSVMPEHDFVRLTTKALGIISAVAIVWEAMPTFLVPACA